MEQKLTIYYTSDTHGVLFPEDSKGAPYLLQSFAEFHKDENTLILDGGDTLQGSPILRYLWQSGQVDAVMPELFNAAKMDYYTIGNHDFNYGYEGLAGYVKNVNAQCLCANVKDCSENATPLSIKPYVIHTLGNGMRVGIVGIVTDNVNLWEAPENIAEFTISDPFVAAKDALEALNTIQNGKKLVDFTICIYHGGFEEDLDSGKRLEGGRENIGCKICKELEFDLLLTAHQHMEQPLREYHGTKILQLPFNAQKYAKVEVAVSAQKTEITSELLCPKTEGNVALLEAMRPIRDKAQSWLAQRIGSIATAVPAQEKIPQGIYGSALADLANLVQLEASGAEVAITSLPNQDVLLPQEITVGDLLRAYPFPNAVVTLRVPGKILAQGVARSAQYFTCVKKAVPSAPQAQQDALQNGACAVGNTVANIEGAGATSLSFFAENKLETVHYALAVSERFLKPKAEHYNYDFFAGVSYTLSFPREGDAVVENILVNGEALEPERDYQVVMSDYRATGTGGYPFYAACETIRQEPCDLQALLLKKLSHCEALVIPKCSQITVLLPQ